MRLGESGPRLGLDKCLLVGFSLRYYGEKESIMQRTVEFGDIRRVDLGVGTLGTNGRIMRSWEICSEAPLWSVAKQRKVKMSGSAEYSLSELLTNHNRGSIRGYLLRGSL